MKTSILVRIKTIINDFISQISSLTLSAREATLVFDKLEVGSKQIAQELEKNECVVISEPKKEVFSSAKKISFKIKTEMAQDLMKLANAYLVAAQNMGLPSKRVNFYF